MEWIQVFIIISIWIAGIFYIHLEVREIRKDMQYQGERNDKLYEMFIELLKNKK